MNFLAHIYLSGENDDLKIGNFMADSIKGKDYEKYSGDLRKGILLHRKIDSFTDSHPTVFKSSHRLFKKYGHYNTVITDVFYDHFLAKDWNRYHPQSLARYVADFYQLLDDNFGRLPMNVQRFFPVMKKQNWLLSYAEISGIERILFQMNNRVVNGTGLHKSVAELREFYPEFEEEFRTFFPQLEAHVEVEKRNLV